MHAVLQYTASTSSSLLSGLLAGVAFRHAGVVNRHDASGSSICLCTHVLHLPSLPLLRLQIRMRVGGVDFHINHITPPPHSLNSQANVSGPALPCRSMLSSR